MMKIRAPWPAALADKGLLKVALVLAALLLADMAVYVLLLSPAADRLASAEAMLAGYRRRHAEAVRFERQKTLFTGIVAGVPAQKDMPLLVKDFVQMARRWNLRVAPVHYDMPKPGSGAMETLVFSFPVEGRYPAIKRFIHAVETSDRNVGIQDLRLESGKDGVKLSMKLMTYVKGQ